MKTIFFIISLLAFQMAIGQSPNMCSLKHNHGLHGNPPTYKTGVENLRSDTTNVLNYSIYLDFTQASSSIVSGNCEVKFEALLNMNTISLDLLQLTIDSVVYNGGQIAYSYNDTLLVPQFGSTINAGAIDSLTIYYNGTPQTDPSTFGGFYFTSGYYYNLGVGFISEPHNYGRVWHPCFDNFVERATYDFEILTNNAKTAYCNGTRTNVQTVGTDSLLTSWQLATAIPSYLACVAVSEYTHAEDNYFSTSQGINIPVWLTSKAADTTNFKNSFANLNNAMAAYENLFGPYVWEKVGYSAVPFNGGAMEHATNIAYPLVTINGNLAYETLMAHELSHHWWGDWVTCKTAEEMWINEGLASYSESLFLESVYGADAYINNVRDNHYNVVHKAHIDDAGFYALNAVPIEYTYGSTSYNKGADVMHSLRGYLGDTDFFAALQSVQTAYGGSDISSEEFRDQMNTVSGVDVTDFFNDWILSPGFSHFAYKELSTNQNGSNYDVEIVVIQRLKGASSYHNNVPLQLTFMDDNWNTHTEEVIMSGNVQIFSFSIPFEPVFTAVNMNERINDAITAENLIISNNTTFTSSYSNIRLSVTNVIDSALVRVEHNWIASYFVGAPTNVAVSPDRYWTVSGVGLTDFQANMRFEFDATQTANGDLDNGLLVSLGGQTFREDSIVLLYRIDNNAPWTVHPDYSLNTSGSQFDKKGHCQANIFMEGQYSFGYRTTSVGIQEKPISSLTYAIYPNPVDDSIYIDLTQWDNSEYALEIWGIDGQLIEKRRLNGASINELSMAYLNAGTFILILTDASSNRLGSKRIIVK